jgi:hypothetical protein
MSKKLGLLLAVVLLLAVSAPVFAQGAFSDVPSGHWAYQAVDTLSKAGLIEGYPDGTFKGDRQMTRYEFAMAIARMMQSGALTKEGPAGPVGAPGPVGPAGPAGGLTPEQQALLNRLQNEFAPELKKLREDVDNLAGRVADIEAALARKPKVTIGGDIDFRAGLYGTKLGFGGLATTGYPNPGINDRYDSGSPTIGYGDFFYGDAQWGAIHFPEAMGDNIWDFSDGFSIPISDSLKDSFKAPQFMSLRTRVKIAANLSPVTSAGITLLADPLTNHQWQDVGEQSPNAYTPNGIMDVVKVDEAFLKFDTQFIRPVTVTAGKLYGGFGQGLLFNNSQYPMKAGRLDIALTGAPGDGITYTLFSGLIDLEGLNGQSAGFPQDPNNDYFDAGEWGGPDGVTVQHLAIPLGRTLSIGGTYLGTGFGDERGWSADISARVFGLDFWGEWAKLTNWACGCDETPADDPVKISKDRNNTAWVAGLGLDKPSWNLRAQYGEVGPTYAFTEWGFNPMAQDFYYGEGGYLGVPFSLLHPNEEFDPHYINWLDRPLFLDPTNVAKGWEVAGTFKSLFGEKTPLSFRYYDGKAYKEEYLGWLFNDGGSYNSKPAKWRDADAVWAVTIGHQFSPDVTANLTYAQRNVDNVMSPNLVEPDQDFFYSDIQDDPIKVVRLDLNVAF